MRRVTPEERSRAVEAARVLSEPELRQLHSQGAAAFDEGAWDVLDQELRRRERVRDRIARTSRDDTGDDHSERFTLPELGGLGWSGVILLLVGVVLAIKALVMDTTVAPVFGWGTRIHNLGLMNQRTTLMIAGGFAAVIGAVFLGFSLRKS